MVRKYDLNKLTNLLEEIQKEGIKINRNDELSKVLTDIKGLRTAIYLQTCSGLGYLVDGTFYKSEEDLMSIMEDVPEGASGDILDELATKFSNIQTFISTDYLLEWLGRIIDENFK